MQRWVRIDHGMPFFTSQQRRLGAKLVAARHSSFGVGDPGYIF